VIWKDGSGVQHSTSRDMGATWTELSIRLWSAPTARTITSSDWRARRTTAEPESHVNIRSVRVQVSSRSDKDSVVGDDESTIQLGEFFYCTPQFIGANSPAVARVSFQGIKDPGARPSHHCLSVADREQRSDPPAFSTLTSDFHRQFEKRFEDHFAAVGEF
jgi:hypothetical protein